MKHGEKPSICEAKVDNRFLTKFFMSRPMITVSTTSDGRPIRKTCYCSTLFDEAVDLEDDWTYFPFKQSAEQKEFREKRSHWREAYHASRWLCAHAIVTGGFIESVGKQHLPGVWNMDNLMAGSFYHRYQLFDTGTAHCIVWHILIDPAQTKRVSGKNDKITTGLDRCHAKDQWVTRKEGIMQLGVYSRGFAMDQIEHFCKHAESRPLMGSVQTQWNPENEVPIPV